MKKVFLLAILATLSISTFAQSYSVTPDGLKDASNPEKSFLVINAEGKTAKQLYDEAIKYVNVTYKNPEYVLRGKIENEYISFATHEDFYVENGPMYEMTKQLFGLDYIVALTFKDGKVKYEVTDITMKHKSAPYELSFTGGGIGYFIYNRSGDLKKKRTKEYLETYFNSNVSAVNNFLNGKSSLALNKDF